MWIIGKVIEDNWMAEGMYEKEQDAIDNCSKGEFIVLVDVNNRFPESVIDAKKLYFPNEEKWEESKLYKLRLGS